jgi:predicted DNA-binding protein YlxM (UPF0122 family)
LEILDLAKSLITDDETEVCRITKEQHSFLLLKFSNDLSNSEIAKKIGGHVDSKYVRVMTNEALKKIKMKIDVKEKTNAIMKYLANNVNSEGIVPLKFDFELFSDIKVKDFIWERALARFRNETI